MSDRLRNARSRERRIFGVSLVVAILGHVALFVFSPDFEIDASWLPGGGATMAEGEETRPGRVDVEFRPPVILLGGGEMRMEPPERVLTARGVWVHGEMLSRGCRPVLRTELAATEATVRLVLGADGRVQEAAIAQGAGEACVDELIVAVAGQLRYEWLPDEEVPAPVELLQPLLLRGAGQS